MEVEKNLRWEMLEWYLPRSSTLPTPEEDIDIGKQRRKGSPETQVKKETNLKENAALDGEPILQFQPTHPKLPGRKFQTRKCPEGRREEIIGRHKVGGM